MSVKAMIGYSIWRRFVLFKKYLLESGIDNDHIIEIALDGIENEELRDPKKCYQHIKDAMKDDQKYYPLRRYG